MKGQEVLTGEAVKTQTVITDDPKEQELEAVRELCRNANEYDGTRYGAPDDADLYLLLYREKVLIAYLAAYGMGETHHGRPLTEIAACTRPEERKKGCFSILLDAFSKETEGNAVLRFAVNEIPVTIAVLSGLGAVRDHAELMMCLPLAEYAEPKGQPGNCKVEKTETEDGAEEYYCHSVYSECRVRLYGDRAYIYGVLTCAGQRRKHRAETLLRELFGWLLMKKCTEVFLEVSDRNEAAMGLYRKLGFEVSERISYYLLEGQI